MLHVRCSSDGEFITLPYASAMTMAEHETVNEGMV